MNKPRVSVITLGCKSNQCDSFFIQNFLNNHGYEVTCDKTGADICIINTCTVTRKSDFQSRQEIRRALRRNPRSRVYVTGCYAVTGREAIEKIDGVTGVFTPAEFKNFLKTLVNSEYHIQIEKDEFYFIEKFPGRTRAFFKIQDGCNYRCSYCIVPYARGNSRSMEIGKVIDGLIKYRDLGYKEVVLTGVHLGSYGLDLSSPHTLLQLLEKIALRLSGLRIRISSLDPHEISEDLISLVASYPIFCKHFHIPLQSGDNTILKLMRRNYTRENFTKIVNLIKNKIPDAGIGIDVIAGFPGEGEKEFENTYELVESLPLSYLHVFPFSIRKGTVAEKLPEKVAEKIIKERTVKLIALGKKKKMEFYAGFVGKKMSVLVEKRKRGDYYIGLTDNYIPVLVKGGNIVPGQLLEITIDKMIDLKLVASTSE